MAGLFEHLQLRQEMISFQEKDPFPLKIEEQFKSISDKVRRGVESFGIATSKEVEMIEKLVFDRFGMQIKLVTDSPNLAAIIPFHLNENAILMDDIWKDLGYTRHQAVFKEDIGSEFKGWVDPVKVKMGGDFSKFRAILYFNFNDLFSLGLTIRECVAVLLHELGHNWYACEYTSRMDEVNTILSDSVKFLKDGGSDKAIQMVRSNLRKNKIEISEETVRGLTSSNPIVLTKAAFSMLTETTYSQMMSGKYNETSFEQLADNFSARFGYGQDIVTGLEKLYPGGVRYKYYFDMLQAFNQATAIVKRWVMMVGGLIFISNSQSVLGQAGIGVIINLLFNWIKVVNFVLITIIATIVFINQSGDAGRPSTYDDLVFRFNRVRLQLVEEIKQTKLPKAEVKRLIASYEQISKMIEGVKQYRGPIDFLFNTFNPKDRNAKSSIERQQALENMLSNPIFVAAAKLDTTLSK